MGTCHDRNRILKQLLKIRILINKNPWHDNEAFGFVWKNGFRSRIQIISYRVAFYPINEFAIPPLVRIVFKLIYGFIDTAVIESSKH